MTEQVALFAALSDKTCICMPCLQYSFFYCNTHRKLMEELLYPAAEATGFLFKNNTQIFF